MVDHEQAGYCLSEHAHMCFFLCQKMSVIGGRHRQRHGHLRVAQEGHTAEVASCSREAVRQGNRPGQWGNYEGSRCVSLLVMPQCHREGSSSVLPASPKQWPLFCQLVVNRQRGIVSQCAAECGMFFIETERGTERQEESNKGDRRHSDNSTTRTHRKC